MAAAAPRKRRQMPGLWTQIEIGNDRRTHRVVLRALPAQVSLTPGFSQVVARPQQKQPFQRLLFHTCQFGTEAVKTAKLFACSYHRSEETGVNDIRAATMTRKVLLTGRPGCGKTTLIKRVVNELAQPAGGFYTEEIRERGERVGFKIITLDG